MMNKNEAMKQIEELKAKLAELEATINEPEYKPEDLIGKLCYVWNSNPEEKSLRIVKSYDKNSSNPYKLSALTSVGCSNAEPVPEADVLKMIYKPTLKSQYGEWYALTFPAYAQKPSRYDWSKVPAKAKYMYTDSNGNVFWSTIPFTSFSDDGYWLENRSEAGSNWDYVSQGNPPCADWEKSEEARPE